MQHRKKILTLQDVEADTAELVNVGVVDLGQKANLRGRHGVFLGQEQLQLEDTAYDAEGAFSILSVRTSSRQQVFLNGLGLFLFSQGIRYHCG